MYLRKATIQDWKLLLEWRNDPETRQNSHNMDIVNEVKHMAWLADTTQNKNRVLCIAFINETPVGTIRANLGKDFDCELSWTIAPSERKKGYGKEMIKLFVSERFAYGYKYKCEIKEGNSASIKIAESCGMKLQKQENNILYYTI